MSEIKIHDQNIAEIHRQPGDNRFIIRYKDGKEKFVEDKPMKNPREYNKRILDDLSHLSFGSYFEYLTEDQKEIVKRIYDEHVNISNPRKKYRELRKPTRPGNYQKIMKEIDEKPNEWRFRLLPPGKFHPDSFRSKEITEGVRAITGCEKGKWSKSMQQEIGRGCKKGFTGIQALRLSKSVFKTKESAAKWIAKHTEQKYRTSTSKSTVSWKEFIKGKMSPYMKSEGSHGGAIRRMGKEWKLYKKEHGIN